MIFPVSRNTKSLKFLDVDIKVLKELEFVKRFIEMTWHHENATTIS